MSKLIKEMTPEEFKAYRHEYYLRHKAQRLSKQKEYYEIHKKEIRKKANNRYRIKCGLTAI